MTAVAFRYLSIEPVRRLVDFSESYQYEKFNLSNQTEYGVCL